MSNEEKPTSFSMRTTALTMWAGQAFEEDLTPEIKQLLKDYAIRVRLAAQADPELSDEMKRLFIAHLIIDDLSTELEGYLLPRYGFKQILTNLGEWLKTQDEATIFARKLKDPNKQWICLLGPEFLPSEADKLIGHVNEILESGGEPFVIYCNNPHSGASCRVVFSFDESWIAKAMGKVKLV